MNNNICYLRTGEICTFITTLNDDKYIVRKRLAFRVNNELEGFDSEACYIVSEVFEEPPVQIFEDQIKLLHEKIENLTIVKNELEKVIAQQMSTYNSLI